MPRRNNATCAQPGCPDLTTDRSGRCPTHRPPPWAGSTRRSTLPPDWARRTATIRRRDNNQCQWPTRHGICGKPAHEVDHRVHRDNHNLHALWLLCPDHHTQKTNQEAATGRARGRR